jgi:hypothetical protein
VDLTPRPTTIAALAGLPAPRTERPMRRRLPLERLTFRVRAILVSHHLSDDDSDYHLILRDPAAVDVTMVAEIPDSACALGSAHIRAYNRLRRLVDSLPPNTEVEVEGVAFWDRPHGQAGMAPNAIELHPVLRITPIDRLARFGGDAGRPGPVVPADSSRVRVWLNTSSRVYHCPGSEYYGRTARGEYLTEAEARRRGGRPTGGRPCPSNLRDTGSVRRP